jgi:hypothetical protein
LISWGSELLVFDEEGYMAVGQVSPQGFEPRRRYWLGDSIAWTHPAILSSVPTRIIVKDGSRLVVYSF